MIVVDSSQPPPMIREMEGPSYTARGAGSTAAKRPTTSIPTPPLHAHELLGHTPFNREFAAVYLCAILALLCHHIIRIMNSTTYISFLLSLLFLIADAILAFQWACTQSFRMRPIRRLEFLENLEKIITKKSDHPAVDIFICTADPYKEPPLGVVDTALSVMAYDYPAEKISVYVSDDGGSELTLFAFMEAAKFARHWLPFCRRNNIVERAPQAYFRSNYTSSSDSEYENIKTMYESISSPDHLVERPFQADVLTLAHRVASCNYERQTHWGTKLGFRYGSLVEDYYTGYRLQSEGWNSIFCHPDRPAFLGDAPVTLIDLLGQYKRWCIGPLEVLFSKYNTITYGIRSMGLLMGLAYSHYACWGIWSIPIAIYAFIPQLALLNGISTFPKATDLWFFLYLFSFIGANLQDLLDYVVANGTIQRWWNCQRMWMISGLSSFLFGCLEFSLKSFGIAMSGFSLTAKVQEDELSKRYEQGTYEFGVPSPLFVPMTMAAIINFITLVIGSIMAILRGRILEELVMQILLSGFVAINCWPIYQAIALRSDKGRMPTKVTLISMCLTLLLCIITGVILQAS
ncbi:hypothetical protein Ancab_032864 [Ancistrocladus abbreviatus]